jgi:Flp pilus assembly protein TadG
VRSASARLRQRASDDCDEGSATIWMIAVVVCTFLMVGLLLDGGTMLRARSDAFSAASAAARAGAQQLDPIEAIEGRAVLDPIAAEHAATDYLRAHGMSGTASVTGDTVTVDAVSSAHLQMVSLVGGGAVSFHATASVQAIKVVNP